MMRIPHPPALAVLESLADFRLTILQAARVAREEKNLAAAKELTAQAAALRAQIVVLRRNSHTAWTFQSKAVQARLAQLKARLDRVLRRSARSQAAASRFTRALAIGNDALTWARRLIP